MSMVTTKGNYRNCLKNQEAICDLVPQLGVEAFGFQAQAVCRCCCS